MYDNVIFDEIILTNIENVKVNEIITDNIPQIVLAQNKLARQDGVKIFNKEYGAKKIIIEGHIQANSRAEYLRTRNTLVKATEPVEKVLQLPLPELPVQYTATVSNVVFNNVGGGFGRFSIEFIASDPYARDVDDRVLVNGATTTTGTYTFDYAEPIGGSYRTYAFITVSVASVTGGTGAFIELTNNAGESIKVTRDWVDDDVLTIDFKNYEVKVNGVLNDYNGIFWNLNVDDTALTYEDNFTTRTVGVTMTYKRRYI
jgi:hypothetical protein